MAALVELRQSRQRDMDRGGRSQAGVISEHRPCNRRPPWARPPHAVTTFSPIHIPEKAIGRRLSVVGRQSDFLLHL